MALEIQIMWNLSKENLYSMFTNLKYLIQLFSDILISGPTYILENWRSQRTFCSCGLYLLLHSACCNVALCLKYMKKSGLIQINLEKNILIVSHNCGFLFDKLPKLENFSLRLVAVWNLKLDQLFTVTLKSIWSILQFEWIFYFCKIS